jgi:hypothetical protein
LDSSGTSYSDPSNSDPIEQLIQQALAAVAAAQQQIQSTISNALSSELVGLEQSGVVAGFKQGGDGSLTSLTLSSGGLADLIQGGYSLSFTSATAGTIAIGGQTIGWSISGLGQFILTGLNVFGGLALAATLEQPAGGN